MVVAQIAALAGAVIALVITGIFIRDAAAQGLGPALSSTGAGLGGIGSGIGQVGTGIGTGISGAFKPFTDLLSFFQGLGSFFGTTPAAGGPQIASQPAGMAAARTGRPQRPADQLTAARIARNAARSPLTSTVIGDFVATASGAMKAPLLGGGFRVSTATKTDLSRLSSSARAKILGSRGL